MSRNQKRKSENQNEKQTRKQKMNQESLSKTKKLTIGAAEFDARGGREESISTAFASVTVGDQQRFGLIVLERVVTVRIWFVETFASEAINTRYVSCEKEERKEIDETDAKPTKLMELMKWFIWLIGRQGVGSRLKLRALGSFRKFPVDSVSTVRQNLRDADSLNLI